MDCERGSPLSRNTEASPTLLMARGLLSRETFAVRFWRRKCAPTHSRRTVSRALSMFLDLLDVAIKVDPKNLIGAADVQIILRLSHPSSVTTYLKRYPDFPRPVVDLSASRVRLW